MQYKAENPLARDLLSIYRERRTGLASDKWESYLTFYESQFRHWRDEPLRILEIGVQNGGSMAIWAGYFPRAEVIVGCDIAPSCAALTYNDPRIRVVVGDATLAETASRIEQISQQFDIVIDDGSHRASDIVKTFGRYFPLLSNGGMYVVEDLHCSYMDVFEGGIEAPFSAMSFFKRLTDFVNREHWGAPVADADMLGYFAAEYGIDFSQCALDTIVEVRFRNSLCVIVKGAPGDNALGRRVVSGDTATLWPVILDFDGKSYEATDETNNPFGPLSPRSETIVGRHGGRS